MADINMDLTWSITDDGDLIVELITDEDAPALASLELNPETILGECRDDMANVFDVTADPGEWITLAQRLRTVALQIERTVKESVH